MITKCDVIMFYCRGGVCEGDCDLGSVGLWYVMCDNVFTAEEEEEEEGAKGIDMTDMTDAKVLAIRRQIYLTIMSR